MTIVHSSNSTFNPILPQPMYPHALLVRGRVGYAYIFKQYGTRRIIGRYCYPYNTKSPAQLVRRNKFAYAVFYWQGFNDTTKEFYNSMTYPNVMSGYNRYIHFYMNS